MLRILSYFAVDQVSYLEYFELKTVFSTCEYPEYRHPT